MPLRPYRNLLRLQAVFDMSLKLIHEGIDSIQTFHTCSCHKFRFASRYHQTHDLDGEITIIDVNTTLHVSTPSYLFSIRSNSIRHQLWRDPTSLTFHFHALKRELNKHF